MVQLAWLALGFPAIGPPPGWGNVWREFTPRQLRNHDRCRNQAEGRGWDGKGKGKGCGAADPSPDRDPPAERPADRTANRTTWRDRGWTDFTARRNTWTGSAGRQGWNTGGWGRTRTVELIPAAAATALSEPEAEAPAPGAANPPRNPFLVNSPAAAPGQAVQADGAGNADPARGVPAADGGENARGEARAAAPPQNAADRGNGEAGGQIASGAKNV